MSALDPGLLRDLTEAKADLARHGVVIVRSIEMDLQPAIMSAVKGSMASSPKRMAKMDEGELDEFIENLRRTSEKSAEQLRRLYVRLLAKLGGQFVVDLVRELDGIGELIKWERMAKAVDQVNEKLVDKGFQPIELSAPEEVSESLKLELEQKWPSSFARFKKLAKEAAAQLEKVNEDAPARPPKTKRPAKKV